MTLGAALQNGAIISLPAALYAIVALWFRRLTVSEIRARLGLSRGKLRPLLIALAGCLPAALVGILASYWTSAMKGSMLAPFMDARPSVAVIVTIVHYDVLGTGLPEELLFREARRR